MVDPMSRKLCVPLAAIYETRALQRQQIPSLCLLFLANRCRQGIHCHQAHADVNAVLRLRAAALQLPNCCARHGEVSSFEGTFPADLTVSVNGVMVALDQVSTTKGLHSLFVSQRTSQLQCSAASVCRLHAGERCRYAEDCKFIHVCREVVTGQLAQVMPPLSPDPKPRMSPDKVHRFMLDVPPSPMGMSATSMDTPPETPILSAQPWAHDPYAWRALEYSLGDAFA